MPVRRTTQSTGPGLALLAPAGDRGVDMTSAVKFRANAGGTADGRSSLHAAHPGAIRPSSDGRSKCDRTVASGSMIGPGAARSVPPPGSV